MLTRWLGDSLENSKTLVTRVTISQRKDYSFIFCLFRELPHHAEEGVVISAGWSRKQLTLANIVMFNVEYIKRTRMLFVLMVESREINKIFIL